MTAKFEPQALVVCPFCASEQVVPARYDRAPVETCAFGPCRREFIVRVAAEAVPAQPFKS